MLHQSPRIEINMIVFEKNKILAIVGAKAELLQLNRTHFPSLGIFVNKKVGNQKN
jgi:hypothetical protein